MVEEKYTIDNVKEKYGLYRFLRGSWSHGIAIEGVSDYDYGGVYLADFEDLMGLRSSYIEQVSDKKNDETYYELGRWMELLLKSNPTALESLFVDKKFVIGDIHPAMQNILDRRTEFLSKEAFNPLIGYATTQIQKASGYNKKCNIPEDFQRKGILDFCYTFMDQGSIPFKDWLNRRGLNQRFCGLVNIPKMKDNYGVYYDFAAQAKFGGGLSRETEIFMESIGESVQDAEERAANKSFYGYVGVVNPDDEEKSNSVRLCSIPKGEKPICTITYNKDGYTSHCKKYREWVSWKENRNQQRYSMNKGYNFDAKNMCETVRLIHTGIELARDGAFNVERTWDRDFLLDIKHHKVSYEEIMEYVVGKKAEFDALVGKCTLPDTVNRQRIEKLLIDTRKELYSEYLK